MTELIVFWYIHKNCNQRCWYCYEQDNNIQEIIPSRFHIDRVLKSLSTLPKFTLSLLGGEITMWKDLEYLVHEASYLPNIKEIQITTNGTNLGHTILSIPNVRINLSLHLKYFNRFDLLKVKKIHPTLIYDVNYSDVADKILSQYKMPVKLVRGEHNTFNYLFHEMNIYNKILAKYNIEDRKDRYIPVKVNTCSKGYQFRIDYDGKVYHTDYKCLLERNVNMYINPQDLKYKIEKFPCTQNICYGFNNCCRNIPKEIE